MSNEEKTEAPSSHKLREARKRGEVASSKELTGAAGFAAALGVLWAGWEGLAARVDHMMSTALALVASADIERDMGVAVQQMLVDMLWVLAPPMLAAVAVAMLVALVQTRGVLSMEPLKIDMARMNPGEAFSRLFSSRQGMELLKMLLKLALLLGIVALALKAHVGPLIAGVYGQPEAAGQAARHGLGTLFAWAAGMFLLLGGIDYAHQFYEFMKQNRMSKTERKREHRDQEGDPYLRSELRTRRKELLGSSLRGGLRSANVVVTNPTHFAVALYYEAGVVDLPVVVAKGQDANALRMRLDARQRGVPILENPPLARSLFRSVGLGEAIGDEHVDDVAEVFRWLASLQGSAALPTS